MISEPLWYYDPGSEAHERLVSEAMDDTNWDALERSARTGQRYWVVIRQLCGQVDRLGPYVIEDAVELAHQTREWDRRAGIDPPRQVVLEPAP